MDGVRGGAVTVVVVPDWVRHVRDVIGAVEVLTIPAGREEDLSTHAVGTLMIKEVFALCPVWVACVRGGVILDGVAESVRPLSRGKSGHT